jgi:FADH2 O2-dependent halogenase
MQFDVGIVGSGFAGSLCAAILARQGLRVFLVDHARHPRFAIGESSTPLADLILRDLATRYDLPELLPLTRFGTWRETYPELLCGCKQGFSYFHQTPQQPFFTSAEHSHELLIAASESRFAADTHWYRADVDQFLCQLAARTGAVVEEGVTVRLERDQRKWKIHCSGGTVQLAACDFLIDASGAGGKIFGGQVELELISDQILQAPGAWRGSRAIFAHFDGVELWSNVLAELEVPQEDYPFSADDAALHQVLQEGWMWQLRFENGRVSAGIALDLETDSPASQLTPAQEWQQILSRYPSLGRQFKAARIVGPAAGLVSSGRLQRFVRGGAGVNWAMLPHSIGFVDPLHSTGIAHTLSGIERLIPLVLNSTGEQRQQQLSRYAAAVLEELQLIYRFVGLCYRTRWFPRSFHAATQAYFVAVTTYERLRLEGEAPESFLWAVGGPWSDILDELEHIAAELRTPDTVPELAAERSNQFAEIAALRCTPQNQVGLLDPDAQNLYRRTSVAK